MRCFLFWTLTVLTAVNVFAKTPDADELHRRVKRSGGEVIIQRIPSVSAKRNYCVPASVDMVLRYYDTRVGQRTLGKLFDSSKKNGTYSRNIVKEFGKGELSGFWSRRINDRDRLIYKIIGDDICIIACRYHYDDH